MAQDPYKYFRVEARELLDQLGQAVLDLEKGGPAPDLVGRILRLAHTLKGAARVVRQREIADRAHAVEEALAPFRQSTGAIPRDRVTILLGLLDDIGGRLTSLGAAAGIEVTAASPPRPDADAPFRTLRTEVGEMDKLLEGVAEAHAQLEALRRSLGSLERARHVVALLSEQVAPARRRDAAHSGNGRAGDRVRPMVEELRALFGVLDRRLLEGVDEIDRGFRQVRDAAERLRLVPVGVVFTSLERAARDVAQAQAKRVVFEARGADERLDGYVLEVVQSALLQLVRNAVAHGIEPEVDRKTAGKPPDGRVVLDVVRRGRHVIFACRDDGRGVDLDGVRRAVQRKGLLSAETQGLGPEDLLRLLLRGGLSTSGTVTEVSGRGIGLDVVRETADRLGGEVTVRTEAGQGTTVTILVPLSVAALEALVIEASGVTAAIPLDAVRRTVRLSPADVTRTADRESVVHDGQIIPYLSLTRPLGASGPEGRDIRRHRSAAGVVVEAATGMAALGVDRLLGTASVILRPLSDLAPAAGFVAGAALDDEGNPQLVLDPDGIVAEAQRAGASEPEAPPLRAPILVIDDSLTTRMLEQSILESAGYDVDLAVSGDEALEMARRKRYALFLVDIEMPGMDGLAFIERTQSDAAIRGVPSILVTSRASVEDRKRGRDVGAAAYIVKSEFDQGELLDRIRDLVGSR